ncbi:hypothetical protein ACFVYR_00500 [Streptomyces sp. NPDC058284]|uniref:hypothetical protein n=1 Tax=unclassified Streptomyces TaxID=2593676 RepID=UPI003651609E
MTIVDTALTAIAFLFLIATHAYAIHRLNAQHAERIALRTYSRTVSPADRHDHRNGGRGRFPARRRRDRTSHKRPR